MTARLFGITFNTGAVPDILAAAEAQPGKGPRLIVTANMDHIISLSESADFRTAYDGAAARTLDGMPLVWLARLRGQRQARRVTGHDLLRAALEAPDLPERRIYLICATAEVGRALSARLEARGLPAAALAMTVPPFGFEADEAYALHLAETVRAHGTTLLVLGIGAPRSEIWVDRYAEHLGAPLVLAVGEALNVAAGLMPRAPVLMQNLGLEWLFRFVRSPRRLFGRYFVRSWRFVWIAWTLRAQEWNEPVGQVRRAPESP